MRALFIAFFFAAVAPLAARAQTVTLLADGDVSMWEYKSLEDRDIPQTRYRTAPDEELGGMVLLAESDGGASGWVSEREDLDFSKTPWVHFQWRVDSAAGGFDEGKKPGMITRCGFILSRSRA